MQELLLKEGLNFVMGKVKFEKIKKNLVKRCESVIAGEETKDFEIKYPLEWKIWDDKKLKLKICFPDIFDDNSIKKYRQKLEAKKQEIESGVYDEYIKHRYKDFII